jgi:hypothetical protein
MIDRGVVPSVIHAQILVVALPGVIVHTTSASTQVEGVIPMLKVRTVGQGLDVHGAKFFKLEICIDIELIWRRRRSIHNILVALSRRCDQIPELFRDHHVATRLNLQGLYRLGEQLQNDTECAVFRYRGREEMVKRRLMITVILFSVLFPIHQRESSYAMRTVLSAALRVWLYRISSTIRFAMISRQFIHKQNRRKWVILSASILHISIKPTKPRMVPATSSKRPTSSLWDNVMSPKIDCLLDRI